MAELTIDNLTVRFDTPSGPVTVSTSQSVPNTRCNASKYRFGSAGVPCRWTLSA